jgi:hypothetical protein
MTEASHAVAVGTIRPFVDLASIYDLTRLNAILKDVDQAPVSPTG